MNNKEKNKNKEPRVVFKITMGIIVAFVLLLIYQVYVAYLQYKMLPHEVGTQFLGEIGISVLVEIVLFVYFLLQIDNIGKKDKAPSTFAFVLGGLAPFLLWVNCLPLLLIIFVFYVVAILKFSDSKYLPKNKMETQKEAVNEN